MIEKIIIQDPSEVHSVWIPERRSMASFAIWKAFGVDRHAHWHSGQIMLGIGNEDTQDPAAFMEFPGYMDRENMPAWVDAAIAKIDAALPALPIVSAALDDDSGTITQDPPAYRVPDAPSINDIATCIVAARLLIAVRDKLILPAFSTDDVVLSEIDFSSRIAVLLGGHTGWRAALATVSDAALFSIIPDTASADDLISVEQDHE